MSEKKPNRNLYAAAHGWIERDGKVLITKRAPDTRYMPGLWDIPGGTVEWGESPYEALKREIDEETTIQVKIGSPFFIYNNMVQFPQRQTFQIVFKCQYLDGEITLNPREHTDFDWVDPLELRSRDCINFVEELLDIVQSPTT